MGRGSVWVSVLLGVAGFFAFSGQTCLPPAGIPPDAAFVADVLEGEAPLAVQFTDLSDPGSVHIRGWFWSFGDGGTSAAQHPRYIYQSAGVFSVELTVTSDAGADIETKDAYVTVLEPNSVLDTVSVVFPKDGAAVVVPEDATGVPLLVLTETNAPLDTSSVSFTLDDAVLGSAQTPPFLWAYPDLTALTAGEHEIVVQAFGVRYPESIVESVARFTLTRVAASADAYENGIPDNPFAVLPGDGDVWLSAIDLAETGQQGAAAVVALSGQDPADAVVVLGGGGGELTVRAPAELLLAGEAGALIVQTSPDAASLFGTQGAAVLGRNPEGTAVAGSPWTYVSFVVSQDGGATFASVDAGRLSQQPLRVRCGGLTRTPDAPAFFYGHSIVTDGDELTGVYVEPAPGFWSTRYLAGFAEDETSAETYLRALSALTLFEETGGKETHLYDDFEDGQMDAERWVAGANMPGETGGSLDFSVSASGAYKELASVEGGYCAVESTLRLTSAAGATYLRMRADWFEGLVPTLGIVTDGTGWLGLRAEVTDAAKAVQWRRDVTVAGLNAGVALRMGFDSAAGVIEFYHDEALFASYPAAALTERDAASFGRFAIESGAETAAEAACFADGVYVWRYFTAANAVPQTVYVSGAATSPFLGTQARPLARFADALTLVRNEGTVQLLASALQEGLVLDGAVGLPALTSLSVAGEEGAAISGAGSGTGILVSGLDALTLSDVEVRGWETGIAIESGAGPVIMDGVIVSDNAGAGIDVEADNVSLRDSTVADNGGRGVWFHAASGTPCVLERCFVQNNGGCGIYATGLAFSALDSVITGNAAGLTDRGAGVMAGVACALENNTIADNTGGAGIFLAAPAGSRASVHNNILVQNGGAGLDASQSFGTLEIDYNDAWENVGGNYIGVGQPGVNAVSIDPVFAAAGDYHLARVSQCINAGSNVFAQAAGRLDIDGETRIQRGTTEIGADETAWDRVQIVLFPDANLEAAVRAAIEKPAGDIYSIDLVGTGFTVLRANGAQIADLTGLGYCTDLVTLELANNAIAQLGPLDTLTGLHILRLGGNDIVDVMPLAALTELTRLELDGNNIEDIAALDTLENLRELLLGDNEIKDIDAIAAMQLLTSLELQNNAIEDIQPLVDNPGINTSPWAGADFVDLRGNPLSQDSLCTAIPIIDNRGVDIRYDGTCAAEGEGEGEAHAIAWGSNVDGQLGLNSTISSTAPMLVTGLGTVVACDAGDNHSLAAAADGTVWAWGSNSYGQLGDGTTTRRLAPTKVPGLSGVKDVAGGAVHSLALKRSGTVWAWGNNTNGRLGDGTTTPSDVPVPVSGLTSAIAVAAGKSHSVALRGDGTVWAWGSNASGQAGNDIALNQLVPGLVEDITDAVGIAAGDDHSLAVLSDGTVWAWGLNTDGQLGDNTLINHSQPAKVDLVAGAVAVAAGGAYSLALTSTGTVWAWGANGSGQLGDGSTARRMEPIQVQGLLSIANIGAGAAHSLAARRDGTVWTWGHNGLGQLGDGTTTRRTRPVQVPELINVIQVSGGNLHSLAIQE